MKYECDPYRVRSLRQQQLVQRRVGAVRAVRPGLRRGQPASRGGGGRLRGRGWRELIQNVLKINGKMERVIRDNINMIHDRTYREQELQ